MENKEAKPNCYKCIHKMSVPGSCHSRCNNITAKVTGHPQGIKRGWFMWPYNFDPVWLQSCDGFSDNIEDKKELQKTDPLLELLLLLK